MKKIFPAVILVAVILVYSGFSTVRNAKDVMKQLGIPEEDARNYIWWSLSGNTFSYPGTQQVKKTPVSERAGTVQQICAFAKSYTESDAFRKQYLEQREASKPVPPEKPEPVEEMRARMKKEMEKSIQETEKAIESMPPEHHEMMRANVEMLKEQAKSYDDPNNPMFSKDMEDMMKQNYEFQMTEHKNRVAEWEKNYPADPKPMVKGWLEEFLDQSKDVDFKATLVDGEYGKKVFAKREYEMKPANWKLCYRAGKESVDAARGYVKGWLDELNKK